MIGKACCTVALLLASLTAAASARADQAGPWPCSWVRGRLMAYNGTPTFRIWPRGTNRLLGVADGEPGKEYDVLPPSVVQALGPRTFGKEVWGDFRVCPVTPDREGWMRTVRLLDARVLTTAEYGASKRGSHD